MNKNKKEKQERETQRDDVLGKLLRKWSTASEPQQQ